MIAIAKNWEDYKIIDTGDGEKLERWGQYILRRPDPQIFWSRQMGKKQWDNCDAHYIRSSKGGGSWKYNKKLPESWTINYKDLRFLVKPTGFKHTGIFPEQSANWDYMSEKIKNAKNELKEIKVLNLFGYTGCATCAVSKAGATEVVHVDASKGVVNWAKDNAKLSGLENNYIRYMVDDAFKFVDREGRRGNKYHGILMDPPSYGRGPKGEIWKIENELDRLLEAVNKILVDEPLFFLINCYTTGFSPIALDNMIKLSKLSSKFKSINTGQIALPTESGLLLPCGIFSRCDNE